MKKAHIETDKGEMVIELFEDDAPGAVANFVGLATGTKEFVDWKTKQKVTKPFYDGLTFHRVIDNFMVQGGCPMGTGTGGPGYQIKCETSGNRQKHVRGTLSMAHAGKDTGGSQFFICHSPQPHLDKKHTVFGQVKQGMDVVNSIKQNDVVNSIRVD